MKLKECSTDQLYSVLPRKSIHARSASWIARQNYWFTDSVVDKLNALEKECDEGKRGGAIASFPENGFTLYYLEENLKVITPITRSVHPDAGSASEPPSCSGLHVVSNDGDDRPIDATIDNALEPIERWPGEAETAPTKEEITDFVAKVEKIGNKRPAWKIMLPYIPTTEAEAKDPVDIAADAGLQLTPEQAKSRIRAAKYNLEKHFGKTIRHKANPSNLGNDKRQVYWIDDLKTGEARMPAPKHYKSKPEKTAASVERTATETAPVPPPETGGHINPPGIPKVDPRVNIEPKLSAYDLVMGAIGTGAVVSAFVTIVEDGVKKTVTFPVEEEG